MTAVLYRSKNEEAIDILKEIYDEYRKDLIDENKYDRFLMALDLAIVTLELDDERRNFKSISSK